MKSKFLFIIVILIPSFLFSQDAIYNQVLDLRLKQGEKLTKVFSLTKSSNISTVTLQIKGFDYIQDNILPSVVITINNSEIFTGTLSDYTFGKNNKYGDFEINITDFVKNGNNTIQIEYAGLMAYSYVFLKSLSVVVKQRGFFFKELEDFNYDHKLYTDYLKKTLTIQSTVSLTENYQIVNRGMQGTYYGESAFNPKFACVKWNTNLNKNVKTNDFYPKEYTKNAYNVPYAYLKISKLNIELDNRPPLLISTVENNIYVQTKNINVSGRVTDENGIYAVYVNNIKTEIDAQGYYNLNFPLNIGLNNLKIKAFDNFGNYELKNLNITRKQPQNDLPPTLELTFPLQSELVLMSNFVELQGKVTDDNNVSHLQIVANKSLYNIYVGNNENFKVNLNLFKGENNIEISAFDDAGNKSQTKQLRLFFEPQTAKPVITLLNPSGIDNDNVVWIDKKTENLPVSVIVSSQFPIANVSVNYINTPVSIPLENIQNLTFGTTIRLPITSLITVKIIATDINSNISDEFVLVLKRRENEDLFPDIDNDFPITNNKCEDCYALIIGNAEYDAKVTMFNSLPYAKNDAEIFSQYLINTFGVPSLNIKTYYNLGTKQFSDVLNLFIRKIEGNDNGKFLFYYSGHGSVKNQNPYFVPVDYNEDLDNFRFINSLYVDSVVYDMLLAAPSKLTVIMDMCYSGKESKGYKLGENNFEFDGPVVVFSASEGEAYPFTRRNHSLFTYSLLKLIHDTKGNVTYKDIPTETQRIMNKIIETEEMPVIQKLNCKPSSVLDNSWESWKLP